MDRSSNRINHNTFRFYFHFHFFLYCNALHCITGVGYGKIKYLKKQYGPGTIHMMELIKKAIDPNNIMNPGKVVN